MRERELHAKIIDAFIVDWISKYMGVEPAQMISVGLADNPYRWRTVCSKCPLAIAPVGPSVRFPGIELRYLFTVGNNEAVPPVRYGILVGQCPSCQHVYYAKGVIGGV